MADQGFQIRGEEHRIRQRFIEAAAVRLTQQDYHDGLIDEIGALTGHPTERVRVYFQTSEDVVIAIYARFASDLESRVMDLPEGTLGERFRALMEIKFEITEPYRKTLAGLVRNLSNRKSKLGILSRETEAIRVRVRGVLAETIEGATDHGGMSTDLLSQNLYSIYLSVMWLWFRDTSG